MKTAKSDFLKFVRSLCYAPKKRISLTIKHREGKGVVAEFCADPDYGSRSGLYNSGATFYHTPEFHDITPDDYKKWAAHLEESAEAFLKDIAAEDGIYVAINGTKVCVLTKNLELGRIVYAIKED